MPTDSCLLLAIGIHGNGSAARDRIESLLRRGRKFSPHASETGIATSVVVLGMLLLGSSLTPRWMAFAEQEIAFEAASIRQNNSGSQDSIVNFPESGRLTVTNATIKTLIRNAYGIQNDQIAGDAKWLDADRYDIQAKTAAPIKEGDEKPLLENLLANRFHLQAHWEKRDMSIYALRLDKSGPKFVENKGEVSTINTSRGAEKMRITATRFSLLQLAGILSRQFDRVVLNETGLIGYYDFSLEWDPEQAADSQAPSIFAALQEQMGLRLESSKGSVPVLVVDHVEKPDAN